MQQVEYKCPHCAEVVKAPPTLEGECGECPKCKRDVDRWPAPVSRPLIRQQTRAPQPPALAQAAVWHYTVGENRRGPVTEAQLKSLVEIGSLRPTDLVWRDGMPEWVHASRLPGLFPGPAPQPPTLAPAAPPVVVQYAPAPVPVARPVAQETESGRQTQECPYCCETISVRAKRCPVCGETVDAAMREAEQARREAKEARRDADDARREARRRPRRDREIVYRERPTCPHALHLIITILTVGLWLPVWFLHWLIVECS